VSRKEPGTYTHAEARQLAEASNPLMVRVVDQLIAEVLEAQGRELVAGRALERIAAPDPTAPISHGPKIARDALDTLERLKEK
jgi:hypothetical protein